MMVKERPNKTYAQFVQLVSIHYKRMEPVNNVSLMQNVLVVMFLISIQDTGELTKHQAKLFHAEMMV